MNYILILLIAIILALLAAYLATNIINWGHPSIIGGQEAPDIDKLRSFYLTMDNPDNSEIIGLHYTDWCPYCKAIEPEWAALESLMAKDRARIVKKINRDIYKDCGVASVPTIVKFNPTTEAISIYKGPRVAEKIIEWATMSS
jgi:thiol-disulfide isomerase/thioredoxin